jgi:hypothetical protein
MSIRLLDEPAKTNDMGAARTAGKTIAHLFHQRVADPRRGLPGCALNVVHCMRRDLSRAGFEVVFCT